MGPDPSADRRALVFTGGDAPDPATRHDLPAADLVIAADSGVEHALALGFAVDVVVGDFDSADPDHVEAAVAMGATLERHPADKDATDLELALVAARGRGARDVLVVGGGGGRLDHLLANTLLLASAEFADLRVTARFAGARLSVVRSRVELSGRPGALCSLLALGGPATGVRTDGLRFPLAGETLHPGSSRGVSNELLGASATVTLDDGVLLAVLPCSGEAS
jgi:thiamine pyrophosphokinase